MKKARAIFTIIEDGHQYFKIWYKYYTQFFDEEDIYVLIFGKNDSVDKLNCNTRHFPSLNCFEVEKGNKIGNQFKRELLNKYQYVVYADYDEIIFYPDGLGKYLDSLTADYVTCVGYEIVHRRFLERDFDFTQPILDQRSYWYHEPFMNKTLITKIDINWRPGKHYLEDRSPIFDGRLKLIHFHKLDYKFVTKLNEKNLLNLRVPAEDGSYNLFVGKEFESWWNQGEVQSTKIYPTIKNSGAF